jgi:hypothetical protein
MAMIHRHIETSLTGRARVRSGWFGRQVLQVQWRILRYSACQPMPGSDPKEWWEHMRAKGDVSYEWRDATQADMQELDGFVIGRHRQEPPRQSPSAPPPVVGKLELGPDCDVAELKAELERAIAAMQKARDVVAPVYFSRGGLRPPGLSIIGEQQERAARPGQPMCDGCPGEGHKRCCLDADGQYKLARKKAQPKR